MSIKNHHQECLVCGATCKECYCTCKEFTEPQHSVECECPQCENNKILLDILSVLLVSNKMNYSDLIEAEVFNK